MRFSSVGALFEAAPATQFAEQFEPASGLVAGPIKGPGPLPAGAVSDRTPSSSVCAFAVELGPHHGTRIRYPCSAASTRMIPPPRAGRGTFTTKYFLFVSRSRESRHGENHMRSLR